MSQSYLRALGLIAAFLIAANGRAQTNQECLECHADQSLTTTRKGKEVSLFADEGLIRKSAHAKVNCIACHTGFDPLEIPHKERITPVACVSCHNKQLTKHSFHPAIISSKGMGTSREANCKGCHGEHNVLSIDNERASFRKSNLTHSCGSCHKDAAEAYRTSAHAEALSKNVPEAPNCLTCHAGNVTKHIPGQDSTVLKITQEKMCISCHLEKPEVAGKTLLGTKFIASYEKSIHGFALLRGNHEAANCVDCHGNHEMNKSVVSTSKVNKLHIAETCAQCHNQVAKEYTESAHGESVKRGNKDAPACTDCHGEHDILEHTDPRSPVSAKNLSQQVCGTCHASLRLINKYGLSADRFQTFSDSYHGLAMKGGALEVANCASCHGAHNIKSSQDTASTVSKARLVETCGKCHPGANERFVIGKVHSTTESEASDPLLYWVATFYILFIVVLVGGMLFHNAIDLIRKIRRKVQIQKGLILEEVHGHRLYLRMSGWERLQHALLAISFILLVLTGFMLRYPESWWVAGIRGLSDSVFEWRSWIHRISGIALIAVSLFHIGYVSLTVRGRQLIRDLMLRRRDMTDAIALIGFNLGLRAHRPKLERFSYIEKLEYWALVWGTVVMGVTGVILWFENASMGLFTKLGWDVARAIHFYEAVLATLAIVVWHFYFVIFNPEVYPMNLSWLTGMMSEKEMAEEHGLELERIKTEEERVRAAAESNALKEGSESEEH